MSKAIVTTKRLITYIRRNPGLTCCQLTKLLRPVEALTIYTSASFSKRLLKLVNQKRISRVLGHAVHSDKIKAWRFYDNSLFKEAPSAAAAVFTYADGRNAWMQKFESAKPDKTRRAKGGKRIRPGWAGSGRYF